MNIPPSPLGEVLVIILVVIAIRLVVEVVAAVRDPAEFLCTTCDCTGLAKRSMQGSSAVELIVWLIGIAIALIFWSAVFVPLAYSLFRMIFPAVRSCSTCGLQTLVPLNSVRAQKMRRDLRPASGGNTESKVSG